jgi:hypothetical protein
VCSTSTAVTLCARDNPHATCEHGYKFRSRVSVWAGIIGDIVLGPYLLSERLTSQRYRGFQETVLPWLHEDMPLVARQKLWFQHDGSQVHCRADIRQWFNVTYLRRWIGRRGPIIWPPRSPDLTPMDIFLWVHLVEQVYAVPSRALEDVVAGF